MKKFICIIFFALFFIAKTSFAYDLPITSYYGWRNDPITGEWKFHSGLDLGYDYGTGIVALFDGQVTFIGNLSDGYGNQIVLYHPQMDCYTRYAHCSEIYAAYGSWVSAGDIIASVGSTGRSTGPHVHIEYIVPDGNGGYVFADPLTLWYY